MPKVGTPPPAKPFQGKRTALVDADEVYRTLELLLPHGQVTEVRILDGTFVDGRRWPTTLSGYFDDPDALVGALFGVQSAKGIYVVLNPVNPALLARAANRIKPTDRDKLTTDGDIVARHFLPIDCDPVRPPGISSTNDEHDGAIDRCCGVSEYLGTLGWPDPIIAGSGNGGHLLYRINLPVNDGGLVERCLAALAARFDDDVVKVDAGVFNPARIWKLYGTPACKGDSTPDRPHRMSKILSVPDELVAVSRLQLEELANETPNDGSEAPKDRRHESNGASHKAGTYIDGFIKRHSLDVDGPRPYHTGRLWTFHKSVMCEHHADGAWLIQFANGAIAAGCHHNSCSWRWHDLRAKLEPKSGGGTEQQIEYRRITSKELATGKFTTQFLIQDTLVAGQPLVIAGPHKSLKTSILIDAAIRLEAGDCFLGALPVTQRCRVAVMSGEGGLTTLQETAKRICRGTGRRLEDCSGLIWSPDLPKFGSANHLDALERFLTADGIDVLFCDPAYLAMPGADAGNLFLQGELLRGMTELCLRLGVTPGLAHHAKHNIGHNPFEPMELSDIAWAGFAEFARQWWLLSRRERYVPGTGEHKLWLSVGGSAGHSALWAVDVSEGLLTDPAGRGWEVGIWRANEARESEQQRRDEAKAAADQRQLDVDRAAVRRVLAKHPTGLSKTAIGERAAISGRRWPRVFAHMLDAGELVEVEVKVSNHRRPMVGYILNMKAT